MLSFAPRVSPAGAEVMGRLQLFGSSQSGNCLKTRWVAERLDLPFDWEEVDVFSGATRTPAFLGLNPAGQVPVAVLRDGRVLAQSNAIMLHLADGSALIPVDAYDRAKMFEWLFWEQYSHEPAVAVRIARRYYLRQREEDIDPALLIKGHSALARMEAQLAQTAYLVGGSLSLADIALVAYTRAAPRGGFDLTPYVSVRAWISRVEGDLGLASLPAA